MKILSFQDVSFSFPQRNIFSHLNIEVHKGDFIGIYGENGNGKTTLVELLIGIKIPDDGSIQWYNPEGEKVSKTNYNIEYISQKVHSIDMMIPITVNEILKIGNKSQTSIFQHNSQTCSYESIETALKHVSMEAYINTPFSKLSGGQKQRVLIAKALIANPDIIIMDEPTAGVDMVAQKHFYDLLVHLNQAHQITILLVSHDLQFITDAIKTVWYVGGKHCNECHQDSLHKLQMKRLFHGKKLKFIT